MRQKAGLNRVILNTGVGRLQMMLADAAIGLIPGSPAHVSQTCFACGATDPKSFPIVYPIPGLEMNAIRYVDNNWWKLPGKCP